MSDPTNIVDSPENVVVSPKKATYFRFATLMLGLIGFVAIGMCISPFVDKDGHKLKTIIKEPQDIDGIESFIPVEGHDDLEISDRNLQDMCKMEQYTTTDIGTRNTAANCWYGLYGVVYNLSKYLSKHPGGSAIMLPYCGKIATNAYKAIKKHDATLLSKKGMSSYIVGRVGSSRKQISVKCSDVKKVAVTS